MNALAGPEKEVQDSETNLRRTHEKYWEAFFYNLIDAPVTEPQRIGENFRRYCSGYKLSPDEERVLKERVLYELVLYFDVEIRRSELENWFQS